MSRLTFALPAASRRESILSKNFPPFAVTPMANLSRLGNTYSANSLITKSSEFSVIIASRKS
ncbi:hypothetical protein [Okeania sp. SIO3I5]|uniref:hypothetical protein n=1 Tax=Okeania sp. SIO3I5 TaxID=2607805 RepID=UPI0025FD7A7F|nr:hypothetical protein [Okeania sp. SIO3I5]